MGQWYLLHLSSKDQHLFSNLGKQGSLFMDSYLPLHKLSQPKYIIIATLPSIALFTDLRCSRKIISNCGQETQNQKIAGSLSKREILRDKLLNKNWNLFSLNERSAANSVTFSYYRVVLLLFWISDSTNQPVLEASRWGPCFVLMVQVGAMFFFSSYMIFLR